MQAEEQRAGRCVVTGAVVGGQLRVNSVLRFEERSQTSLQVIVTEALCVRQGG